MREIQIPQGWSRGYFFHVIEHLCQIVHGRHSIDDQIVKYDTNKLWECNKNTIIRIILSFL